MSQDIMTIKDETSQSIRAMAGSFGSSDVEFNAGALVDTPHSINDDFLIEDLSNFSNEDIAAPIQACNFSPPQSDDTDSTSTIKSDCTANSTHTNSSATDKLLGTTTALGFKANYSSGLHSNELKDVSLSLPCQDETGFEWLASLGDENYLFRSSNFGMDSFLLDDPEPFSDYNGVHMKESGYEDAIQAKEVSNMGEVSPNHAYQKDGQEDRRWDDEDDDEMNDLKDCEDLAVFVWHIATGSRSARAKRIRSSGWSSTSSILCNNWSESTSPTNSLNSSSQIIMPITPRYTYSNPSFICNQEEGCHTHLHHASEINASSRIIGNGDRDPFPLCDFNKTSKIGLPEPWPKNELDNSRVKSGVNYADSSLQPRRCTHCQSQKTPQWRAGPQGPKTLCNACGVRYKSGRLFDEYRPAKSPTFLSYRHSNSHKKVMEMRRRKSFQYNHHQQHTTHHVRTPPLPNNGNAVDQQLNVSKLKMKLDSTANLEPLSTHFSDVTLISNRNAIQSPSRLLY